MLRSTERMVWIGLILAVLVFMVLMRRGRLSSISSPAPTPQPKVGPSLYISEVYDGDWTLMRLQNPKLPERNGIGEGFLHNKLVDALQGAIECDGIRLFLVQNKKSVADFTLTVNVNMKPSENWTWLLGHRAAGKEDQLGGMGTNDTVQKTSADICKTIWDDIDPNHFKRPGVKIEQ